MDGPVKNIFSFKEMDIAESYIEGRTGKTPHGDEENMDLLTSVILPTGGW
jgi:hypothetical protein